MAIAGVVALRPDILILDEATSMLDPRRATRVEWSQSRRFRQDTDDSYLIRMI